MCLSFTGGIFLYVFVLYGWHLSSYVCPLRAASSPVASAVRIFFCLPPRPCVEPTLNQKSKSPHPQTNNRAVGSDLHIPIFSFGANLFISTIPMFSIGTGRDGTNRRDTQQQRPTQASLDGVQLEI
jgi:hypothetical protein